MRVDNIVPMRSGYESALLIYANLIVPWRDDYECALSTLLAIAADAVHYEREHRK